MNGLTAARRSFVQTVRRSGHFLLFARRPQIGKVHFFSDMSDETFWNKFYADRRTEEHFDWFLSFEDVQEHVEPFLPRISDDSLVRILDIGCGTSAFSVKLFEHLSKKCRIDCIDFSKEAIEAMERMLKKRGFLVETYSHLESGVDFVTRNGAGFTCHVTDAKALPFAEETFSLVIDKGTCDAILKGANGEIEFIETVVESLRVLKVNGRLIQFSDEPPEVRLDFLEKLKRNSMMPSSFKLRFFWRELEIRSGFEHFMYIVHKEDPRNEKKP